MPKFETKKIQSDLEQGEVWPVYWVYGSEQMKIREIVKRIKERVKKTQAEAWGGGGAQSVFEGGDFSSSELLDCAQSMDFSGGIKTILVKEAHQIKDLENLKSLFLPSFQLKNKENYPVNAVIIFISKDLDSRKKSTKWILEKAAVISCDEVLEYERDQWVLYLAKRHQMELENDQVLYLRSLEPWSLDRVEQEILKWQILSLSYAEGLSGAHLLNIELSSSVSAAKISEKFIEAFFKRDISVCRKYLTDICQNIDLSFVLVGLLGWNFRMLILMLSDAQQLKLNPYVMEKLRKYLSYWTINQLKEFQTKLLDLDFSSKQKPIPLLSLWENFLID